jgi:hypothetical protein
MCRAADPGCCADRQTKQAATDDVGGLLGEILAAAGTKSGTTKGMFGPKTAPDLRFYGAPREFET